METTIFTSSTISDFLGFLETLSYFQPVLKSIIWVAVGGGLLLFLWETTAKGASHNFRPVLVVGARFLLGGILFFIGGIVGLFDVVALPAQAAASCTNCGEFLHGLMASGYMYYLVKWTELIAGAMIIAGLWVPLALVIISPIVTNILLYHIFLDTTGLLTAIFVTVLTVFLAFIYREAYLPLFQRKVTPQWLTQPPKDFVSQPEISNA